MPVSRTSALLLLLATLACGGDDPEPEPAGTPHAEERPEEFLREAPQPVLTAAESAASVAAQARRADSVTRAVMGEVPKTAAPRVETMEDQIALCRTQAAQAVGTIREHLLAACKRLESKENPK